MIVYLLLAIVCLIIVYEFCANYEKFQSPSQIGLIGNSRDGVISLFWHRPHANYENIYQYLLRKLIKMSDYYIKKQRMPFFIRRAY